MRTVVRTKTINGTDYLYENTYYYDKASRRTQQHSRGIWGKPSMTIWYASEMSPVSRRLL
jgi:hypothetical protein